MPNLCSYNMKVVGTKENIEEFMKVMKSDYDYGSMKFGFDRHMGGRVFEADNKDIMIRDDGKYETYIVGDCAWSVHSCMFGGEYTYYNDFQKDYGEQSRSTTLELESKRLNLDVEVFSEECGMCFQEHYLIKNGVIEVDDSVDWYEYYIGDYNSKEEAEKDLKIKITDEEWENEEYISRGGFEEENYTI